MTSRLPIPGQDSGNWGSLLNDYLSVSHNSDGTLNAAAVATAGAATDTAVIHTSGAELVAGTKTFAASPVVPAPSLGSHAATKTYVDSTAASGAPDASPTVKGILVLAGDLSGTASAPTVPALAAKADTSTVNTALAGKEPTVAAGTTSQYYRGDKSWQTLPTAPVLSVNSQTGVVVLAKSDVGLSAVDNTSDTGKPVSTATQTALNLKANTSSFAAVATSGSYADLSNAPSIPAAQVSSDWTAGSGVAQILHKPSLATVATTGSYTDLSNTPTIPTISDATTGAKGVVQLAGDLAGTATAPTVVKLSGVSISGTPSSNQVLIATSGTAAAWATPAAGVTLDGTSSDIQPLGTVAAGSVGKAADAGHVHTMPRLDQVSAPTAGVGLNAQKLTGLANGTAASDGAAFGQIPTAGTGASNYTAGNDTRLSSGLQTSNNLSELAATAATARTNLGLGSAATHPSTDFAPITGTALGTPQPSANGFLAWTSDPTVAASSSSSMTSGTVYLSAVYLAATATVSKACFYIITAGSAAVASQNFLGLYDSTGVLKASAGIDASVTAAAGVQTITFTASASLSSGMYWLALLFNATTSPSIARASTVLLGLMNANLTAAQARYSTNSTGRTSLFSSITPSTNVTSNGYPFWGALL